MASRRVLGSLVLALLLAPVAAGAQQSSTGYRVGLLDYGSADPARLGWWNVFRERMRELGYVEGRDISFEPRWGQGKADQTRSLALELAGLKVDVIVAAGGSAALAAKHATSTIPIVIAGGPDPIGLGLVRSLARPGGNITGITSMSSELSGKLVEFARMVAPGASRVGVLWDETSAGNRLSLSEIQAAGGTLGIAVQPVGVRRPDEFDRAFQAMTQGRAGSVIVVAGGLVFAHRKRLADLAVRYRLPMVGGSREYVDAGGLVGYGTDFPNLFRGVAGYVDRILKGTRPSDLPIEQPTKFELVVNLKTAKVLSVTLPPALLLQANEVIR
jgi:putative ABC transport system substrate-binding protein